MANEKVKIGIALAAGLCIGGGIGYFIAERKVRRETEAEIEGVKTMFRRLRDEDATQARADWNPDTEENGEEDAEAGVVDSVTPESLAEKAVDLGYVNADDVTSERDRNYLAPVYTSTGGEPYPTPNEAEDDLREDVEYVHNIRVINPDREDPNDVTTWYRDPDLPYVITEEEFRIDEPTFEKLSITYYQQDNTLADEQRQYIPDLEGTVGASNLQFFGLASGDPRTLHIRNERVMADFEVTLDLGSYSKNVLGFDPEEEDMEHLPKNKIKKLRNRE
jgi:hypothetical protein